MATATLDTPKPEVTLKLTWEEALVLKGLTGNVIGSPTKTIRKFTDSVYNALSDVILQPTHRMNLFEGYTEAVKEASSL